MDGVIFIRTLTEEQERILEQFKAAKGIAANTKAIQGIISRYGQLARQEEFLKKELDGLHNKVEELEHKLMDYKEFFQLFNKLNQTIK